MTSSPRDDVAIRGLENHNTTNHFIIQANDMSTYQLLGRDGEGVKTLLATDAVSQQVISRYYG